MANIQANVNQMISLAGLLASQNPELRAKSEQRAKMAGLAKQEKVARTQIEAAEGADKEAYYEDLVDIKRQQFETKPTAETYGEYKDIQPKRLGTTEADPEEIAMEIYEEEQKEAEVKSYLDQFRKADQHLADTLAAKTETRKRILQGTPSEYLLRKESF